MLFNSENAATYGQRGGSASRDNGFKQQAQRWVREVGYSKLIDWVDGDDNRKATFAAGLLFSYALGKPVEKLQIDDRKEVYINLSKDEALNAIAARFGIHPGRVLEARDSSVVDGPAPIQAEGPTVHGI